MNVGCGCTWYRGWNRLARALTLLLVAALVLSACAGGEPGGEPSEGGGAPADSTAGGAGWDGSFVVAFDGDVETLDPHMASGITAAMLFWLVYDPLIQFDFDMKTFKGVLAEDWEISEDGLTYTFHLKDGITFHSGTPLTSAHVKWTFDRWRDENLGSPTGHRIASIDRIETPDDRTVVLHLRQRDNELLTQLALPFAGILNPEVVEQYGDEYGLAAADGTGPFVFEEWQPQSYWKFRRHEAYTWGIDSYENRGPAHIKELTVRIIPESVTRLAELEAGNVHLVARGATPPSDFQRLETSDDVELYTETYGNTVYVGFNAKGPLADRRVRQALHHATDKAAVVEGELFGYGIPALGHIAPNVPGALPNVEDYTLKYDVERAAQLLDEAGWLPGDDGYRYRDGERLTVRVYAINTDPNRTRLSILADQWQEVGVQLEPVLLERAGFYAGINAGEHDAFTLSFPHVTPHELFAFYFSSESSTAKNRHNFSNPRVDELLRQGVTASNQEDWEAAYHEVERIMLEESIWIPLYHPDLDTAVHASVEGFRLYGFYGMGWNKLLDVRVEP
ncbi:MAG TPA: ABC transporter substrate-binding protein [Bacillota bacterium]